MKKLEWKMRSRSNILYEQARTKYRLTSLFYCQLSNRIFVFYMLSQRGDHQLWHWIIESIWVFPKCFHRIQRIQWQNICHCSKRARTCHPATFCVRDQDATTVPARHMWETGSLNWAQLMLQWFIRFPEFSEFLFHLGENSNIHNTLRIDDVQMFCILWAHQANPWILVDQRKRYRHLGIDQKWKFCK